MSTIINIAGHQIRLVERSTHDTDYNVGYLVTNGMPVICDYEQTGFAIASNITIHNRGDGFYWSVESGEWRSSHEIYGCPNEHVTDPDELNWTYASQV